MSNRPVTGMHPMCRPQVTISRSSVLQRKCACGNHIMSRERKDCISKSGLFQRACLSPRGRGIECEGVVPPIVHEVLRSTGQPLDAATRAFMERTSAMTSAGPSTYG